ncbi:MAG: hemerythrin domain-containing protein [Candidatus Zixiibacteriota bacterium]
MRPTKILSDEHRVIEVALDCLELITEQALIDSKLNRTDAEDALEFLRLFADTCHHGKEEKQLFTAMADRGMSQEDGPIHCMLVEHDRGREYVRGMRQSLERASEGDSQALEQFTKNARGYIQLLHDHISKEDNVLFPMADDLLSNADQEELVDRFAEVEKELVGGDDPARIMTIIERLAKKLGVSTDPIHQATAACGHH